VDPGPSRSLLSLGSALKSRVGIFDLTEKIHLYSFENVNFPNFRISYENVYEEVVQNLNLTLLFSALPKTSASQEYQRVSDNQISHNMSEKRCENPVCSHPQKT